MIREAAGRILGERGKPSRAGVLLRPLSYMYELASLVRSTAYATGTLKSHALGRPVISVGNITMGGTGKTPLVAALAAYLRDQNMAVAILTRGYMREGSGRFVLRSDGSELGVDAIDRGGDEAVLLATEVPGVDVVVDPDRVSAGRAFAETRPVDVFLLDDGYQHLRLKRDLNILLIDATDPFGGGYLPPSGRLREPLQSIARADVVVVTRADRAIDEDLIRRVVAAASGHEVPIFFAYHDITGLRPLGDAPQLSMAKLRGRPVAVLTAIGNPAVFIEDLGNAGLNVVSESLFADHHRFSQRDVDEVSHRAAAAGAELVLCTEKDAVKLRRLDTSALPFQAVRIEFRSDQEAMLKSMCLKAILEFDRAVAEGSGESS